MTANNIHKFSPLSKGTMILVIYFICKKYAKSKNQQKNNYLQLLIDPYFLFILDLIYI